MNLFCNKTSWIVFCFDFKGQLSFDKYRSLDCALFCCKARRKRLQHERSVERNTRRS